ncbi:Pkinase-domain-containing protein [Gonapodya prolifera JEL478]|uniref:non-specific serine/threonine protein kinase n=1 Tax=Gonapodya prolifera (strain JEL478) TaxID=1344416 RepID=A0A139B079_GONPJ|nr:Pkinase-domain-containing protein [Gonapodya prolifera JEL478]|eukprot:KXS22115.1 Pkinase-domain-containing protein [Gonapodya prolifera JEL478]
MDPPIQERGNQQSPSPQTFKTALSTPPGTGAVSSFTIGKEIGRGSFATVYLGVSVDAPKQRFGQSEAEYLRELTNSERSQIGAFDGTTAVGPSTLPSPSSNQGQDDAHGNRPPSQRPSIGTAGAKHLSPYLSAIKSISRSRLDRRLSDSLDSEIRILRNIRHPNVVSLYHVEKTDQHIHLVMEYCALGDLSHYIKRRGLVTDELERLYGGQSPITPPAPNATGATSEVSTQPASRSRPDPTAHLVNPFAGPWGGLSEHVARCMLGQLACALHFLRQHNLIHRDIKPQNLLLGWPAGGTTFGGRVRPGELSEFPVLKLADFGFARLLQPLSLASTLCGSPLYMAPEILRHHKYDARADLWSVGVVLYEMLCGKVPFRARSQAELLRRIDNQGGVRWPDEVAAQQREQQARDAAAAAAAGQVPPAPTTPLSVPPPVPADMKDLVKRLLRRDPRDRMTFDEFFEHPCVAVCIEAAGGLVLGTAPVGVKDGGEEGVGLEAPESDDDVGSEESDVDDGAGGKGNARIAPVNIISGTNTVAPDSSPPLPPISPPTIATKNPIHPPSSERASAGIMRRGSSGDGGRLVGLTSLTQGVGLGTLVVGQQKREPRKGSTESKDTDTIHTKTSNGITTAAAAEKDPMGQDPSRAESSSNPVLSLHQMSPKPLPLPRPRTDPVDGFYEDFSPRSHEGKGRLPVNPFSGMDQVNEITGHAVLPTPPETLPGTMHSEVGQHIAQVKLSILGGSGSPGESGSITIHPHNGHIAFASGSRSIPVAIASAVAENTVFGVGSPSAAAAIHSASPPPLLSIQPGTSYSPGYLPSSSSSRSQAIAAQRRASLSSATPVTPNATPPSAPSGSYGGRSPLSFVEGVFKVIPQSVAVWRSNSTGGNHGKTSRRSAEKSSSSDEYVIVSKGAVEVEWLADEVAAHTMAPSPSEDRDRGAYGFPSASPSPREGMASSLSLRRHVSASAGMRSYTGSPATPISPSDSKIPNTPILPESLDQLLELLRRARILHSFADDVKNGRLDLTTLLPDKYDSPSPDQHSTQLQSPEPSPTSSAFHTAVTAPPPSVSPIQQLAIPVYVRLLSHYQRCSDYARRGWDELRRRGWAIAGPAGGVGSMNKEDVQWLSGMVKEIRDGFVACLEEAEKGLGRLSSDRKASNIFREMDVDDLANARVEMVVYEAVLDMARAAAHSEMEGSNLEGCCQLYGRAVSLLEVLLQDDDDARSRLVSGASAMTDTDRVGIEELLPKLRSRQNAVLRKLNNSRGELDVNAHMLIVAST